MIGSKLVSYKLLSSSGPPTSPKPSYIEHEPLDLITYYICTSSHLIDIKFSVREKLMHGKISEGNLQYIPSEA